EEILPGVAVVLLCHPRFPPTQRQPCSPVYTESVVAGDRLPACAAARGLASFVEDARRCLRQRKALAHQRLRDLPQTLRVPWIERVGLDAVQGAGSVVHGGDVTVLEIETATPLELRRGRGEHRGCRPGLDGLEPRPPIPLLEKREVFRLQVAAELGQ